MPPTINTPSLQNNPRATNQTKNMKYIILMTDPLHAAAFVRAKDSARTCAAWGTPMPWAKTWKTRAGVERFVEQELANGSKWQYTIIPYDV